MRAALLCSLLTAAAASEFQHVDDVDIRLIGGLSSALGGLDAVSTTGANLRLGTEYRAGPHAGAALVWTRLHPSGIGMANGLEFAFDRHLGKVATIGNARSGGGEAAVTTWTATWTPALAMRADSLMDPDVAPDALQVELGPTIGAGIGGSSFDGSAARGTRRVLTAGGAVTFAWTFPSRAQFLLQGGYEYGTATPGAIEFESAYGRVGLGWRF